MQTPTFAGSTGIVVLLLYAALMLGIGFWVGRDKVGKRHDLKSYYLAGGNLGVLVLFFTLYATQYSGNTVIGYAPEAYREGFSWWQSVTFFTAIIGGYLLFAPRLYVLAKRHSFITPSDWLRHRFRSPAVTTLAVLLMLWALASYLLEQLIAMGYAISGLTGQTVPYQLGVTVFVGVMLVYSWLGGMRAVAFTDVMQGIALLVGVALMLVGAFLLTGDSIEGNAHWFAQHHPDTIAVPSLTDSVNWLSMIIMVGLGIVLYPHAVQRIFSARSERTLRTSLARMAWMPLITAGAVVCIGILGVRLFPGLSDADSERLVGLLANEIAEINVLFSIAMVLLFGGLVAAIVSTADSALLSLSSIIARDIVGRRRPDADEHRLVMTGKVVGIVVVCLLLVLAWFPPSTLVDIFVFKIELLVQLAPVFVLALYWEGLRDRAAFWGMLLGTAVTVAMTLAGASTVFGVHGGVFGLLVNLAVCALGSLPGRRDRVAGAAAEPQGTRL